MQRETGRQRQADTDRQADTGRQAQTGRDTQTARQAILNIGDIGDGTVTGAVNKNVK